MNQKGIAQIVFLLILLAGIVITVYLTRFSQVFTPKAAENNLPKTFKIMPLGDSITLGAGDGEGGGDYEHFSGGYRTTLYPSLIAAGYKVDFVGSLNSGPVGLADKDHEAHHGWTIGELSANLDTWLLVQPDIILLIAGTNDIARGTTDIPGKMNAIVDKIFQILPNSTIIIGSVPPLILPAGAADTASYNAGVEAMVNTKRTQGRKIYYVNFGLSSSDLIDGAHPLPAGYAKIAAGWKPVLIQVMKKPGDADGDNDVDIFDYNLVVTNFGKTGAGILGDLDNNNLVDIFDYNLVLTNFGK